MKLSGYRLVFVFFIITTTTLFAQDTSKPWFITLGSNAVNNPVSKKLTNYGRFQTWNLDGSSIRLSAGRLLTKKLIFESIFTLNSIIDKYPIPNQKVSYAGVDGIFKYRFINEKTFDPFVQIGGGYTWVNQIGSGSLNSGFGTNLWFNNSIGLQIQTLYKQGVMKYGVSHWQHSAALIIKLGKKDTDNDGIIDDNDKCPDEFGLIEFNGCPDTDGDGVIDSKDLCPINAGPSEMSGCPDNDGDGTPDKYDSCPKTQGPINNNGCPLKDTDSDGIIDKQDKCPKTPGVKENNGCPKVLTQLEKATQQAKIREYNNGIKKEVSTKIGKLTKLIKFNDKNTMYTPDSKNALDAIATVMAPQLYLNFHIAAHTDTTGSSETNTEITNARAENIRVYLTSKGVKTLVTIQGYGDKNPIANNNTKQGRLLNNRIEIFIVN